MKRFQNSTIEYSLEKNELVIRDANTNGIFFAIDFFNDKQIKRIFSLYPVNVELQFDDSLELKFSVETKNHEHNVLTLLFNLKELTADKKSVINIPDEDVNNITFN